ncbi:MAG: ADP-ribosylglycohydrolase family protein [Acidimicrobiales bacterium]|nr:ADP-ribosylglycohydrolase family protein [Acidimicrobiales bacterium]
MTTDNAKATRGTKARAIGALLGLAVGDAVGTTLEFKPPGTFEPITDMVGGGPFGLTPGQWTDDTSMAMCLAESILDTGELDAADQLRRYVKWRRDGYWSSTGRCFDIGATTTRALSRFERDATVIDATIDHEQAANGSLMRLASVPVRWFRDPAEAAQLSAESSRTTHPAARPVDACRLYGAMIAALIGGADIEAVLAPGFWSGPALDPEVEAVARGSWRAKEPPQIRGTGFVVAALEAAIWAVAGAEDFRDAVLRAANLGDDADTTAAIAGQLAGARWGVDAIPAEWREKATARDRITAIAAELHDAAAPAVSTDADLPRWEHEGTVHAWWAAPRVLAGEYPGHPTVEKATHKVNLLVDRGIRTFVDLTTPADRLTPYDDVVAAVAANRGLDLVHVHHPIPDISVLSDGRGYDDIVASITAGTERGGVYVHCWGGVGRTATVIGCLLVDQGLDGAAALERIATLRSGTNKAGRRAPETPEQESVIRRRGETR